MTYFSGPNLLLSEVCKRMGHTFSLTSNDGHTNTENLTGK